MKDNAIATSGHGYAMSIILQHVMDTHYFRTASILVLLLAGGAGLLAAEVPQKSTAPKPSLLFNVDYGRDREVSVAYRWRWNDADLRALPAAMGRWRQHPFTNLVRVPKTFDYRARFNVYGLRFAHTMSFLDAPPVLGPARPPEGPKPALAPDARELRALLGQNLRRNLISGGFELALPAAKGLSYSQKETMTLDLWKAGELWGLLPEIATTPPQSPPDPLRKPLERMRSEKGP